VTAVTPTELQRLIAAAFDSQGWRYDLEVGPRLVNQIRSEGQIEAEGLARSLPGTFFDRNRVSREVVANVLRRALAGRTLEEEQRVATKIVIGGNNYEMNIGSGTSIIDTNINVGEGTQIVASSTAEKRNVLLAIEAITRAGLTGEWNEDAAKDLAAVVNDRSDLDYEDVQRIASEVVKAEQPPKERVKEFLGRVAASGIGGALGTGITTGLTEAMTRLPL
jgi:hypothetical protein